MRTETEFKLLPYLHSKFLGSEHVTNLWLNESTLQRREEESRRHGQSASFTSFKQQGLFNDTVLFLHRNGGKCGIDKHKKFFKANLPPDKRKTLHFSVY